MKRVHFLLVIIIISISCKKDNSNFLPKYEPFLGTWNLQSVSYDSSGVNIIKTIPYDKLVINDNLDYHIFMHQTNPIEDGTVNIVTQTNDKLVLYFSAQYPSYSSFAGSHIFGVTNVELVSLSDNEMIITTIDAGYAEYSDRVITFKR